MNYRSGLEIKATILKCLRERSHTISEMETKVRTSDRVLHRHLKELEFLGIVQIIQHEKSPNTGRPYKEVKLKSQK